MYRTVCMSEIIIEPLRGERSSSTSTSRLSRNRGAIEHPPLRLEEKPSPIHSLTPVFLLEAHPIVWCTYSHHHLPSLHSFQVCQGETIHDIGEAIEWMRRWHLLQYQLCNNFLSLSGTNLMFHQVDYSRTSSTQLFLSEIRQIHLEGPKRPNGLNWLKCPSTAFRDPIWRAKLCW